jgi:hypothetical protein
MKTSSFSRFFSCLEKIIDFWVACLEKFSFSPMLGNTRNYFFGFNQEDTETSDSISDITFVPSMINPSPSKEQAPCWTFFQSCAIASKDWFFFLVFFFFFICNEVLLTLCLRHSTLCIKTIIKLQKKRPKKSRKHFSWTMKNFRKDMEISIFRAISEKYFFRKLF